MMILIGALCRSTCLGPGVVSRSLCLSALWAHFLARLIHFPKLNVHISCFSKKVLIQCEFPFDPQELSHCDSLDKRALGVTSGLEKRVGCCLLTISFGNNMVSIGPHVKIQKGQCFMMEGVRELNVSVDIEFLNKIR